MSCFEKGTRVELPAHTDAWAFGNRYGTVVYSTNSRTRVKLDKGRKTLTLSTDDLRDYGKIVGHTQIENMGGNADGIQG